jgi:hypothetical protein
MRELAAGRAICMVSRCDSMEAGAVKGQAQQLPVPHPPSIKMENSCKTELANGSAAIASRDQFRFMSDVCGNALSSAPFVEDF